MPPALKPQWEFFSSSSFFPGNGSAEHGLDPSGTLLSLCSVVPPRLVSSLLRPPACDLGIDLSSLSSSMSQFLKCIWRRGEWGQERRGCRRRRKRRGTDVPCVVVLSPCRLTYRKSDMRQERANRGTDRSPSLSCTSLTCVYCLFCVHVRSWSGAASQSDPLLSSFILHDDDRAAERVWPSLGTSKLKVQRVKNS